MRKEASLYFHFPFCAVKCPYCHFAVCADRPEWKPPFLKALLFEWKQMLPKLRKFSIISVYFGGGTPTLFPEGIVSMMEIIATDLSLAPSCEITVEANPESLHFDVVELLLRAKVNRISVGIQSLDNALLQVLGRRHSAECGIEALMEAKRAGIDRLSIDLMYELPHQTRKSWEATLAKTRALPITHISLYNLSFEPKTAFYRRYKTLKPHLPSEETSAQFFKQSRAVFADFGFEHYEISAFAKKGDRSVHNIGYWCARPFFGFGPSAFSYVEGKRWRNAPSLPRYLEKIAQKKLPVDFEETLPYPANLCELLAIRLRFFEPLDLLLFQKAFGKLPPFIDAILEDLCQKGWMKKEGSVIQLTSEGQLFYDCVAVALIVA